MLLILFLTVSCEDVIEIQTADAPRQVVIDAWLTNEFKVQKITISESQSYFDSSFPTPVSGAEVVLRSVQGKEFRFLESGEGTYIWSPNIDERLGEIGSSFNLMIDLGDQEIAGFANINPVPIIEEIETEFRTDDLRGPDGIYSQFFARDLPGWGNTYWIKAFKNDVFLNKPEEMNIAFDAGFDGGSQIDGIIFIPPIRELINPVPDDDSEDEPPYEPGDKIRVEIHSIGLDAFEFLTSARDQILNGSNGIFASPIANSPGNLKSTKAGTEVLGIFNIAAVESMEKIVP